MKTRALLLALAAVFAALLAAGCGGDDDELASSGAVPLDQAFIDAMVPHHQDAIEMAEAAKARGLSEPDLEGIERAEHEEVKSLAATIIEAQEREVGILEQHASVVHHG